YTLERLVRRERTAVVVSARTGAGIAGLLGAISAAIPRPEVVVDVLVPYDRGGLISRVHEHGDVLVEEHTGEGTRLRARVGEALAAELTAYAV
ncbi:MAG TPA: GTPase HflX, partial [Sporichthyaceae bacterium]|nr:GTPase HflX [Sporichthyaceae bacterium]